eukprot:TRINITY_DN80435_c0_g1_i1.p1 TRINITY_DN80435_c0_g1~~TRINITY_DN80435_c0_g1_i1.p1  ORF type:complete len:436 (-),score=57.29 TRINITY_DN80435_c0_g1_i1:287-1594(-)
MGLTRGEAPGRRITGKATLKNGIVQGSSENKQLTLRHAQSLLPSLYKYTQGKEFGLQVFESWLQKMSTTKGWQQPSACEVARLLRTLSRHRRRLTDKQAGHTGAWFSRGPVYKDDEGSCAVSNVAGFKQELWPDQKSSLVNWHEYGAMYRLRRTSTESRETYTVVRNRAFKRLSSIVSKRMLELSSKKASFQNSVVIEPCLAGLGPVTPSFSLIYLHSFSAKGTDYLDFPHYFGVAGSAVRVVIPSAPSLEQECFKDWNVWKGDRLGWRRIKFTAWFDYKTDKGGMAENDICLESLHAMRERLHALIRQEVQRVGDPKRVIIGGASQGCCVAIDAAMTYPEELGGVIGLVGHVLRSTQLCPSKKKMPLHLFHETTDREMRWSWVKRTVQRLIDEGFNVISKREKDPSGTGHWIQDIEGDWIRSALKELTSSKDKL